MRNTKNILLSVSYDSIDALVETELENLLEKLNKDLWNRYEEGSTAVFHQDRAEDIEELQKHRSAVETVLSWYKVVK
jgi:predicted 2-oxoglutarate/Fe(II)-dependent dioxygenase YbiX